MIKENFLGHNMTKVWEGIKLMSGHQGKQGDNSDQNSENKDIADKLNAFNCYFN